MSAADVQRALVASVLTTDPPLVGPFAVLLDRGSASPFRNYAAPRSATLPTAAELAELVALFAERGLPARLEYVDHDDQLTDAVTAAGFTVAQRIPLMVLGTLATPSPVPGTTVTVTRTDDDLVGAAIVMAIGYGDDEPIEQATARLGRTIDSGGAVVIARDNTTGVVVSAGLHASPAGGLSEIAAVATHPDFRRRGLAANVAAGLARHAADLGATPFLQAAGADEARIYARIGFERIGSMVFADGP